MPVANPNLKRSEGFSTLFVSLRQNLVSVLRRESVSVSVSVDLQPSFMTGSSEPIRSESHKVTEPDLHSLSAHRVRQECV